MKENNETVTDSVTDDIQTISDNMKQLAENTPKNVVKPDVYASKLPLIIEELRADDKQTVEEKNGTGMWLYQRLRWQVQYICLCREMKKTVIKKTSVWQLLKLILYIQLYLYLFQ